MNQQGANPNCWKAGEVIAADSSPNSSRPRRVGSIDVSRSRCDTRACVPGRPDGTRETTGSGTPVVGCWVSTTSNGIELGSTRASRRYSRGPEAGVRWMPGRATGWTTEAEPRTSVRTTVWDSISRSTQYALEWVTQEGRVSDELKNRWVPECARDPSSEPWFR